MKQLQLTRWAFFQPVEDGCGPLLIDCNSQAATELLDSVPGRCEELELSEFLTPGLMCSTLHEKQLRSLTVQMTGYQGSRDCLFQLTHLGRFATLRALHVSTLVNVSCVCSCDQISALGLVAFRAARRHSSSSYICSCYLAGWLAAAVQH